MMNNLPVENMHEILKSLFILFYEVCERIDLHSLFDIGATYIVF